MNESKGRVGGWGDGLLCCSLETQKKQRYNGQGSMCQDPHALQPLLSGAAFLSAPPPAPAPACVLQGLLPALEVPIGTNNYIRGVCTVVAVSIRWPIFFVIGP